VKGVPGGINPLVAIVALRPSPQSSSAVTSPVPAADRRTGLPINQLAKSKSKVMSSVVGSP